jgi:hypothetical protein
MTKTLAYCAFLQNPKLSLPSAGVSGAPINLLTHNQLQLLWSQVEWPFDPSAIQQHAIEFHQVVQHVFAQTAVIPFRLLSLFDDQQRLADFLTQHDSAFIADLEELRDAIQMECIVFFKSPGRPDLSSGSAYLRHKADLQHVLEQSSEQLKHTLSSVSNEIRVRELKNGKRIYCRVPRGQENQFRTAAQEIPIPPTLEKRITGPWPASEFLSESVKMPEIAGKR